MRTRTETVIDDSEWDRLVIDTYGRTYHLQQQDDCCDRGLRYLTVPSDDVEDFENETVPEKVNDPKMGVSFEAWLARDPKQKLSDPKDHEDWKLNLWWSRNFYPNLQMVANDLHKKGLLEAGEYAINIDW